MTHRTFLVVVIAVEMLAVFTLSGLVWVLADRHSTLERVGAISLSFSMGALPVLLLTLFFI